MSLSISTRARRVPLLLGLPLLGLCAQGVAAAPTGYALGSDGSTLVSFGLGDPSSLTVTPLSGGTLDDIDFRPLTGELYGYDDSTDTYFTVDTATGGLTPASPSPADVTTDTDTLGIDFNPTIDRMRTVTVSDLNIVYNPNDGATTQVNSLFYEAGDANEGAPAGIVANAYTNSVADAETTLQFALDADLDVLTTLANNAGSLATVGALGLDFSNDAGLDILTINGANSAYALLNPVGGDGSRFYSIDLATGQASEIGSLSAEFGPLSGLAVADIDVAVAVPEPATIALFGGGLLLLGGVRRLRSPA